MARIMRCSALLLGACVLLSAPDAAAQGDDLLPAVKGADKATAKSRVRQPEDPETLYNRGLRQLRRGYYDEAIISFEKVKNHFPFNQYSVLSELRVADALFEKASHLEAIDAYRQFTRLHPRHAEIDYATYRMARAEFKVSSTVPQRDQTSTERGLKKLQGFESRFPDSEYTEEVVRIRSKARTRLAKRELQVGNFYWKSREWKAAERRYGMVWRDYSDTDVIYKARYRQGLCLYRLLRDEEAGAVLAELAVQQDSGRWGERAQRFLDKAASAEAVAPEPGEPSQQPAGEPADEPAEEPADEPAEEPADEPAEEPTAQSGTPDQAKLSTGN
jgi:outer membrane protein assembly factor BamD